MMTRMRMMMMEEPDTVTKFSVQKKPRRAKAGRAKARRANALRAKALRALKKKKN